MSNRSGGKKRRGGREGRWGGDGFVRKSRRGGSRGIYLAWLRDSHTRNTGGEGPLATLADLPLKVKIAVAGMEVVGAAVLIVEGTSGRGHG